MTKILHLIYKPNVKVEKYILNMTQIARENGKINNQNKKKLLN
jgi:hypothetical protein